MITILGIILLIVPGLINVFIAKKEEQKYKKLKIFSMCIVMALGVVIIILDRSIPEEIGALKPTYKKNDPEWVNKNGLGADVSKQIIRIGGAFVNALYPLGRYVPIALANDIDGLMIYATITSSDGKVVAKIIKNKWQTNPNNYFRKFSDESSIEIIDEYDIPILQIEYIDYNTVKIGGVFRSEKSFVSDYDNDFPPYNTRIIFSLTGESANSIYIIGEGGAYSNVIDMELQDVISKSREIIKPWFDYSDPSNPSKRLPK